jgi:aryl sulfotransferase
MPSIPQRTRIYQNHHIDSTRWDRFTPRPDDIVIATSYKAGTTWTQAIIANILFPDQSFPAAVWEMSPWLDFRPPPLDERLARLEAQTHRRFIKTHLPLDGLRFFPEAKYIFVSRDGRDVFMSLWNHYSNYTDEAFKGYNETPGRVGLPLPRPPADIHEFWRGWCTRGWFEGETDGWPFWSHLSVTQSWWNHRHQPNILILHYADMKSDIAAAICRIADFLGIELGPGRLENVVAAVSFDAMRTQGANYAPRGGAAWKGGAKTFLNKGTNGRWRDVLSAKELALYDEACERALSPDCREWLEDGGTV